MNEKKRVIDKNMFETTELDRFLSRRQHHIAVVPDIANVEASVVKGDQNLISTFQVLCRHSHKYVV